MKENSTPLRRNFIGHYGGIAVLAVQRLKLSWSHWSVDLVENEASYVSRKKLVLSSEQVMDDK